jgi:hypothetical protein
MEFPHLFGRYTACLVTLESFGLWLSYLERPNALLQSMSVEILNTEIDGRDEMEDACQAICKAAAAANVFMSVSGDHLGIGVWRFTSEGVGIKGGQTGHQQ